MVNKKKIQNEVKISLFYQEKEVNIIEEEGVGNQIIDITDLDKYPNEECTLKEYDDETLEFNIIGLTVVFPKKMLKYNIGTINKRHRNNAQ